MTVGGMGFIPERLLMMMMMMTVYNNKGPLTPESMPLVYVYVLCFTGI